MVARRLLAFVLGLGLAAPAVAGEHVRDLKAPSEALGRDLAYALYRPDAARGVSTRIAAVADTAVRAGEASARLAGVAGEVAAGAEGLKTAVGRALAEAA